MTSETEKEGEALTQYLLGELPEGERERIERSYFADDETFDLVLAAEDEVIDAYVRGELSAPQCRRFEEQFASSPEARARVEFARTLAAAVSRTSATFDRIAGAPPRSAGFARPGIFAALSARGRTFRVALAAAALILAVGLPWLLFELARTRDGLQREGDEHAAVRERESELNGASAGDGRPLGGEQPSPRAGADSQPTPAGAQAADDARPEQAPTGRNGGRGDAAAVVSFVLTPGLVRDSGARTLPVPRGVSSVVLRLNVEAGSFASYRAVIETAGGREVWRADSIKPGGRSNAGGSLTLPALPARVLPAGDYVLLLSGARAGGGVEGVGEYSFTVIRN